LNTPADDLLTSLQRSGEALDAALRQTDGSGGRAALVAGALRALVPSLPLYACLLRQQDRRQTSVLDHVGSERADWAPHLEAILMRAYEEKATAFDLPAVLGLSGHHLAVRHVVGGNQSHGALAVALPGSPSEKSRSIQAALSVWGRELALRLEVEALRKERAGELRYAESGELGAALSHEINNFLNALLLQLAVLHQEGPKELRGDFEEIRRQAACVVTMTRQFRQSRAGRDPARERVDLNALAADVLRSLDEEQPAGAAGSALPRAYGVETRLDPAAPLPAVLGSTAELRHLVRLLLKNAAAVMTPDRGPIHVRTLRSGGTVLLQIEDEGPAVSPQLLPKLFEPTVICREGTNSLELAACRSIVRRCKGKIDAENRPNEGVTITVEFAAAKDDGGTM
jgi:signal transduction histidine kinase